MMTAANDTLAPGHCKRLEIPALTQEQGLAFSEIGPTALWIGGNLTGAQPRFWGDNQGGWPVLFGLTQKWAWKRADRLQKGLHDAYYERDLIARYWFDTWEEADKVQCMLFQNMRDRFDDALGKYLSFDPEVRLSSLDAEIRKHAESIKAEVWTDPELVSRMNWLLAVAQKTEEMQKWTDDQNAGRRG